MFAALALALAATLAAGPDEGAEDGDRSAPRPLLVMPKGSALTVEGRVGGASCGYCGLVLGVAGVKRIGAFTLGGFVEVAASVGHSAPSSTTPTLTRGSFFAGGQAGATGELSGHHRVGVAAEIGVQLAAAQAEWAASAGLPPRSRSQAVPVVGARASFDLYLGQGDPMIGVAAFVRQPLMSPCLDVGLGCKPPATTIGIVLQGSIEVAH